MIKNFFRGVLFFAFLGVLISYILSKIIGEEKYLEGNYQTAYCYFEKENFIDFAYLLNNIEQKRDYLSYYKEKSLRPKKVQRIRFNFEIVPRKLEVYLLENKNDSLQEIIYFARRRNTASKQRYKGWVLKSLLHDRPPKRSR